MGPKTDACKTNACKCSQSQLASIGVPHTLVIGTCVPIIPSGTNGTSGPNN